MVPLIPLSSLQTAPAKHGTPAFDFLRIRAFWAISSRHLRAPRCSNLSRMVKKRDESVLVSLLSFPTRPPAQQKMKNSLDATFRFDFYPKIRAYTGILPILHISIYQHILNTLPFPPPSRPPQASCWSDKLEAEERERRERREPGGRE